MMSLDEAVGLWAVDVVVVVRERTQSRAGNRFLSKGVLSMSSAEPEGPCVGAVTAMVGAGWSLNAADFTKSFASWFLTEDSAPPMRDSIRSLIVGIVGTDLRVRKWWR